MVGELNEERLVGGIAEGLDLSFVLVGFLVNKADHLGELVFIDQLWISRVVFQQLCDLGGG
jgi:hypothetical protein